jgi:hypothetical protein
MSKILENLRRQLKALKLLYSLQKEEYGLLLGNDKSHLQKNQFAIQRLIKQIQEERKEFLKILEDNWGIKQLKEIDKVLPDSIKNEFNSLIEELKLQDKLCMEQATKNADLAIAHLEQTKDLVKFLYEQIRPKAKDVYSRYGTLNEKTLGPCIVNGRL